MSDDTLYDFWKDKTESLNRDSHSDYYRKKAQEHSHILALHNCNSPILDLGCGAGELLYFLSENKQFKFDGVDFSPAIIEQARHHLKDKDIHLYLRPATENLENEAHKTWISTGGINQYSSKKSLLILLDKFKNNPHVEKLVLFDTISPIPYFMKYFKISDSLTFIKDTPSIPHIIYNYIRFMVFLLLPSKRKHVVRLKPSMGFAVREIFWHQQAKNMELKIELIASQYFEYRYHVILYKEYIQ